jgi:hypothetical protein
VPEQQAARVLSGDCSYRAMRGQGWLAIAGSARSAFGRKMAATDRRFTFGIRVARDWVDARQTGPLPAISVPHLRNEQLLVLPARWCVNPGVPAHALQVLLREAER